MAADSALLWPLEKYNAFRSWTQRQWFDSLLKHLVHVKRKKRSRNGSPTVVIIDSQSSRSELSRSQKGIDGNKKIKGIKRHIAVDSNGFPLAVTVTEANVHDSKAAYSLLEKTCDNFPTVVSVKADNGYRGKLAEAMKRAMNVEVRCIKSNYGISEFVPLEGRWVVERTISWLDNFRRLARNYEQYLHTATAMTKLAFMVILLKDI
ncbi:MAG: IS5 family transposase [Bacteroides sp.]|nr:IS5 family transposase [Bacteroides sp.]